VSPCRSAPGGWFGWVSALAMLAVWVWIAADFTRWLFPFATGPRLWALFIATPVCLVLLFRLVHRGWRRVRAWLMGTTPPPWPGRRELAALALTAAVAAGLGAIPDGRVRDELAQPRAVSGDTLGYRYSLQTRLGWWGDPYRFSLSCPGPRPCAALYSLGFSLNDPATGERYDVESWSPPASLALPGGRWMRTGSLHSVKPAEYRRSEPRLRLAPLPVN
jgi:hypothetical protein